MDRISNERIRVITKVGEITKIVQESSLKVVWASSEKNTICGQNNDSDGGVVEEKERKSVAEVVG